MIRWFAPTATVLLFVLALPTTTADGDGTTSTGDVDLYLQDPTEACPLVVTYWTVTLSLVGAAPTDAVGLAVHFDAPPASALVATGLNPTVSLSGQTTDGCRPDAVVTGLVVDGEIGYVLGFKHGGGLPL